jgi:hypothetical protein
VERRVVDDEDEEDEEGSAVAAAISLRSKLKAFVALPSQLTQEIMSSLTSWLY